MSEEKLCDLAASDEAPAEVDTTARGIIQCLRMLAEEAGALRLPETLVALQAALETCRAESVLSGVAPAEHHESAPPGTWLH
jgi:hypothetical protein